MKDLFSLLLRATRRGNCRCACCDAGSPRLPPLLLLLALQVPTRRLCPSLGLEEANSDRNARAGITPVLYRQEADRAQRATELLHRTCLPLSLPVRSQHGLYDGILEFPLGMWSDDNGGLGESTSPTRTTHRFQPNSKPVLHAGA